MGKSKHLASLLSAAGLIGSEDMESDAIPPSGATTYATINDLPLTGLTSGALAYISSTDTFYIANGTGWYKVTTINTAPTIDPLAANTTLIGQDLPTTNTVTTTATGSDPEGLPVDIGYTLEPDANTLSFISSATTVGNDFIVSFIDDGAQTSGTANVVVSASDGINITTAKRNLEILFSIQATGGNNIYTATVGGKNYKFHEFTSGGVFSVSAGGRADILLVGGGGGGGSGIAGGGGGGEVILAQGVEVGTGFFSVVIGTGGQKSTGHGSGGGATNGGSTSFIGSGFTTIAAKGGAHGSSHQAVAGSGGGNGGGGSYSRSNSGGTSTIIASGTHGSSSTYTMYSGYSGGSGNSTVLKGGGGGGANGHGQSGVNAATNAGALGGSGIQILNFDQYSYYYGGGGGGGTHEHADIGGHGGVGGGGGGGGGWSGGGGIAGGTGDTNGRNPGGDGDHDYQTAHGGNGGTNTGGGGGGAGWSTPQGGDGGSGILIIRYQV